jgi:hypothetical protein
MESISKEIKQNVDFTIGVLIELNLNSSNDQKIKIHGIIYDARPKY